MLRKYAVEAGDEADYVHFKPVSQLCATAVLVNQAALTLHIVHNYIVTTHGDQRCTNSNWNTVLMGQVPFHCRYESRAESSALRLTGRIC